MYKPDKQVIKGAYVLILVLSQAKKIRIGKLGTISFKPGIYFYVGSAMKGIEARVKRHLKYRDKPLSSLFNWHIDYLLKHTESLGVVYIQTEDKNAECKIAQSLFLKFNGIPAFGASDCHCKTHLFFINFLKK